MNIQHVNFHGEIHIHLHINPQQETQLKPAFMPMAGEEWVKPDDFSPQSQSDQQS
ncbi:hypothetical protein [Avibacterium paragallinarum]|uniref:Uncharacterized protein n=1 Tax=Avibacterium paragallinarum TaxID=728 RepID=A0A377I7T2_AVIPA|nr:hypothetical protein [Avibacterium paragallinarum]CDF99495.1 Hypothetical protein AJF4211_002130 [Avibacterium paragallinarum JF4211]STO71336.1 Uncharacterised protein [Avibacterium paragallinarum]